MARNPLETIITETYTSLFSMSADDKDHKTPMNFVVKLARFNKISHQYVLLDESGPAHQKFFRVKLTLGDGMEEVFDGYGPSIKKAQQNAAANALLYSKLPVPKNFDNQRPRSAVCRLEKMLAKTGIKPQYFETSVVRNRNECNNSTEFCSPITMPALSSFNDYGFSTNNQIPVHLQHLNCQNFSDSRTARRPIQSHFLSSHRFYGFNPSMYCSPAFINQPAPTSSSYDVLKEVEKFSTKLVCGEHEFFGQGSTRRDAKNNAAQKALESVETWSVPSLPVKLTSPVNQTSDDPATSADSDDFDLGKKPPVSIVHEVALKSEMAVEFTVEFLSGPAHDRQFLAEVILKPKPYSFNLNLPTVSCRGQGGSKKLAKNDACLNFIRQIIVADKFLLQEFLSVISSKPQHDFSRVSKPKRETIVKDTKMDPNYGQQIHPVSRLIQVQQAKKEQEPVFTFLEELGQGKYKEYLMEVTVGDLSCRALGPNKKFAKRAAAEIMLEKMGLNKPLPKAGRPVLKQSSQIVNDNSSNGDINPKCQNSSSNDDFTPFNVKHTNAADVNYSNPEHHEHIGHQYQLLTSHSDLTAEIRDEHLIESFAYNDDNDYLEHSVEKHCSNLQLIDELEMSNHRDHLYPEHQFGVSKRHVTFVGDLNDADDGNNDDDDDGFDGGNGCNEATKKNGNQRIVESSGRRVLEGNDSKDNNNSDIENSSANNTGWLAEPVVFPKKKFKRRIRCSTAFFIDSVDVFNGS